MKLISLCYVAITPSLDHSTVCYKPQDIVQDNPFHYNHGIDAG